VVEKDIEKERGEDTPLQHTSFNTNNKVTRRLADNATVAKEHARNDFDGGLRQPRTSQRQQEEIVRDSVKSFRNI
jgi:hypothetical protein